MKKKIVIALALASSGIVSASECYNLRHEGQYSSEVGSKYAELGKKLYMLMVEKSKAQASRSEVCVIAIDSRLSYSQAVHAMGYARDKFLAAYETCDHPEDDQSLENYSETKENHDILLQNLASMDEIISKNKCSND